MKIAFKLIMILLAVMSISACGHIGQRTSYNYASNAESPLPVGINVVIAEDDLPGRKYRVIGPAEVSLKKLSIWNSDPTKEQAIEALKERARDMGADGVINTTYSSGIGLWTWGYFDADGTGVRFIDMPPYPVQ